MSERLLTFNELSEDRFMLEGRLVEFSCATGPIFAGEIFTTQWWPRKHIKKMHIVEARVWNAGEKRWLPQADWEITFGFDQFEMIKGPYETSTDDVFFIVNPTMYLCIYHKYGTLPEPFGYEYFYAIHRRFMDPEPRKGAKA